MKTTNLKSLKEGSIIKGFFICRKFNIKISRLGDPFIDLFLEDSSGSIRAKIWSFVDEYKNHLEINKPIAVKGKVISFNQALEIDVYHLSIVDNNLYDKYGYSKNLLVHKSGKNIDLLYDKLIGFINKINHKSKKNILSFFKQNKKKILLIPAIDKKYNLSGGFLSQIVSIMKLNNKIYKDYKYDYDLVSIGILLKNIGLIDYYKDDFYSINRKDKKMGYNTLTLGIVEEKFSKYEDIQLLIKNLLIDNDLYDSCETNVIKYLYSFDSLM